MKEMPFQILFEDNHLIAVNKSAGDISQGDRTGDVPIGDKIKSYLKEKYNKPGNVYLALVHRLDRPVSGVMLFARTGKAAERISDMLKKREVQKTYWAVVKNKPLSEKGLLVHHLKKNEKLNKSFAYNQPNVHTKEARLHYNLIASIDNYYLLEVKPETGRHHQIRVQLSTINCPVKGDLKYGYKRTNENAGIHLHARSIEFIHPVKNENVIIQASPPDDVIWNAFLKVIN